MQISGDIGNAGWSPEAAGGINSGVAQRLASVAQATGQQFVTRAREAVDALDAQLTPVRQAGVARPAEKPTPLPAHGNIDPTPIPATPAPGTPLPAESVKYNEDDLKSFLAAFGSSSGAKSFSESWDLNGDGRIDAADLSAFLDRFEPTA